MQHRGLTEDHQKFLANHAIDLETAVAAGNISITQDSPYQVPADLPQVPAGTTGLLTRWLVPGSERSSHIFRADEPLVVAGRRTRYFLPSAPMGIALHLDSHRRLRRGHPKTVLVVAGWLEHLAAVSAARANDDIVTVGITGPYGWKHAGDLDPQLAQIVAHAEKVVLALDAPVDTNPDARAAARSFANAVAAEPGASSPEIAFLVTPGHVGLDVYLASRRTRKRPAALVRLIADASTDLGSGS